MNRLHQKSNISTHSTEQLFQLLASNNSIFERQIAANQILNSTFSGSISQTFTTSTLHSSIKSTLDLGPSISIIFNLLAKNYPPFSIHPLAPFLLERPDSWLIIFTRLKSTLLSYPMSFSDFIDIFDLLLLDQKYLVLDLLQTLHQSIPNQVIDYLLTCTQASILDQDIFSYFNLLVNLLSSSNPSDQEFHNVFLVLLDIICQDKATGKFIFLLEILKKLSLKVSTSKNNFLKTCLLFSLSYVILDYDTVETLNTCLSMNYEFLKQD